MTYAEFWSDKQRALWYVMIVSVVSKGHFTVMGGSEAGADLVLIQTLLFYYVN